MIDYIRRPRNLLFVSSLILAAGLVMMLVGIALAYVFDLHLSIVELVGAHALTLLGPTAMKIGYVMRLLAYPSSKIKAPSSPTRLSEPAQGLVMSHL